MDKHFLLLSSNNESVLKNSMLMIIFIKKLKSIDAKLGVIDVVESKLKELDLVNRISNNVSNINNKVNLNIILNEIRSPSFKKLLKEEDGPMSKNWTSPSTLSCQSKTTR
jgi:hypothetical protein